MLAQRKECLYQLLLLINADLTQNSLQLSNISLDNYHKLIWQPYNDPGFVITLGNLALLFY